MIPIDNEERALILEALEGYRQCTEQIEKNPDEEEYYENLRLLITRLQSNELLVFDTKPQCMVMIDQKNGIQCSGYGRYQPVLFVFGANPQAPIAQLDIGGPSGLRVCEEHAVNDMWAFLNQGAWREIQAQVMKQSQQVVKYEDAKLMYMDSETKTIVPPPKASIIGGQ